MFVVESISLLYVYVSNESSQDVFFDNLQVVHVRGPILEETHYYPFGLAMSGISSKAVAFGGAANKKKFNDGTELQNKEFSDGSGLELYATDYRSYDPQIGRFHQVDDLSEDAEDWSPYSFAYDNPISFNDPLGLESNDSLPKVAPNPVTDPNAPSGSAANPTPMPEVVITNTSGRNLWIYAPDPIAKWNPKPLSVSGTGKGKGNSGNSGFGLLAGGAVLTSEANPVIIVATVTTLAAVGTYVIIHNPTYPGNGQHYFAAPDNTSVYHPPFIQKAEDKTDHMGKPKGNTPGNNQAQNKQIDALAKKYDLTDKQREQLHDRISGQGYGYKEIEKIIQEKDY